MTNGIEVSNSEFQQFLQCRRRWYISYWLRLRLREKSYVGPLQLGSRIHKALEMYYKDGKDLLESHDELVRVDLQSAMEAGQPTDELESDADLGHIMLEGYLDWLAEEGYDDDTYEIIGSEEILKMPLLDGAVTVIGKTDLRVRDKSQDVVLLRDFKTIQSFSSYTDWSHLNPQIKTYMTLDFVNTPEEQRIAGAEFHLLKKVKRGPRSKPPFYMRHEIRHNVFTLRSFWKQLHGQARDLLAVRSALDAGVDHREVAYAHPTRDCHWQCFSGDTEVVTRNGVHPMSSLAGSFADILVPSRYDGKSFAGIAQWQSHQIKEFGEQELYEVRLRRKHETRVIRATDGHLWWVDRGARRIRTDELVPGMVLPTARQTSWKNVKPIPPLIAQGFVFGDGSHMGNTHQCYLEVSDNSDKHFIHDYFSMHPSTRRETTTKLGTHWVTRYSIPKHWKDLPDITWSTSALASWLAGYFAADGTIDKRGRSSLSSSSRANLEFARSVCEILGIPTRPIRESRRDALVTGAVLYQMALDTRRMPEWMFLSDEKRRRRDALMSTPARSLEWVVESVAATGDVETVYCAVVPGDEAFVLAGGIVTSNCPAYHICPLFDDGSDVKGMLEADFEEVDPYDYYSDSNN